MGLDTAEPIRALEERFGIDTPSRAVEKRGTVGELHQFVLEERGRGAREPAGDPAALYADLRALTCEQLGVRPEQVVAGASFVDDLRAN
jgi:hypothetical protein